MTITIEINERPYGLTFGMLAIEELQLRSAKRLLADEPSGNARALTDMFYCAHNNFNEVNDMSRISYGKASELIEELLYSNDIDVQMQIVDAFTNCRATKMLQEKLGEKKKTETKRPKASQTTTK